MEDRKPGLRPERPVADRPQRDTREQRAAEAPAAAKPRRRGPRENDAGAWRGEGVVGDWHTD